MASRLAPFLAARTLSSASLALAPYDSTGGTFELVPIAGGAAVSTSHVTSPLDATTVNLAIPSSLIAAMVPGASLSFFARVTSDALTAGSTCTANALSRQITFTKAGSVTAAAVPTVGTLGLVLLAGLMGVAAYRNRRVRGALNVLLPVAAIAALSFGNAPSLNAQPTDLNTTYAGSANDAIQSVRAVVDAAGNAGVTGTRANNCQFLPLSKVSKSLNIANVDIGTGTITLNRAVPAGTVILASYVDASTGATIALGSLSASANGSTTLAINWNINVPGFRGKLIFMRFLIGSTTIVSATYGPIV